MNEEPTKSKRRFVFEWALLHLLGWIVGAICGFALVNEFVFQKLSYSRYSDFKIILNTFLFGVCVGTIHWFKLKRWKINAVGWILATAIGIGFLGTLYIVMNYFFTTIPYGPSPLVTFLGAIFILVVGGGAIGGLQSIVLSKLIPRKSVWILVNVLGVLTFGIIELAVLLLPYTFKSVILNFANSHHLHAVVDMRYLLLEYFTLVVTPIFSILTIAIPTGIVLKKNADQHLNNEAANSTV